MLTTWNPTFWPGMLKGVEQVKGVVDISIISKAALEYKFRSAEFSVHTPRRMHRLQRRISRVINYINLYSSQVHTSER